MIELENIKMFLDNKPLPCGLSNRTPIITWQIPNDQNIIQSSFFVQLKNIKTGAYMQSGINGGYDQNFGARSFNWPNGRAMNDNWTGLCGIRLVILGYTPTDFDYTTSDSSTSSSSIAHYQYSSKWFYFVFDPYSQFVHQGNELVYFIGRGQQFDKQEITYRLQVSKQPTFNNEDLIVVDESNLQSNTDGYIRYAGEQLQRGVYFVRACVYDSFDESQWSDINYFIVSDCVAPKMEILQCTSLDNNYGDILIRFRIYDSNSTVVVNFTYLESDDDLTPKPCTLLELPVVNGDGQYTVIWRTSSNVEKGIYQDYTISGQPYSNDAYGQVVSVVYRLDTRNISLDKTGGAVVNTSFNLQFDVKKIIINQGDVKQQFPCDFITKKVKTNYYIGYNSDRWQYINENSNISVDSLQFRDMQNSAYYTINVNDIKDFAVYADNRNFLQKYNKQHKDNTLYENSYYTINGKNVQSYTYKLQPSYRRAPATNPIFDKKYSANQYNILIDGKYQTVYFGGKLQGTVKGQDEKSQSSKDKKQYGKRTYADGKCVFQDNQVQSPQYTVYPNVIGKSGYPPYIQAQYFDCIKEQDLYIRKYIFEKGNKSNDSNYGYKNFYTIPTNVFHRYFSNLNLPERLILYPFKIQDESGNKIYELIDNKFVICNNTYTDLPKQLETSGEHQFFINQNLLKSWQEYKFKKYQNDWELVDIPHQIENVELKYYQYIDANGLNNTVNKNDNLFFRQYKKQHLISRGGRIPQFHQNETQSMEQALKRFKTNYLGFSNVAVPTYVKYQELVYSVNGFNGRNPSFTLSCDISHIPSSRYIMSNAYRRADRVLNEKQDVNNKFSYNKKHVYNLLYQLLQQCGIRQVKNFNEKYQYSHKYIEIQKTQGNDGSTSSTPKLKQVYFICIPTLIIYNEQDEVSYYPYPFSDQLYSSQSKKQLKYIWYKDNSDVCFGSQRLWWDQQKDYQVAVINDIGTSMDAPNFSRTVKVDFEQSAVITQISYNLIKDLGYYSQKSKYGNRDWILDGNVSDLFQQVYNSKQTHDFIRQRKTIFLEHDNIVDNSLVLKTQNTIIQPKNYSLKKATIGYKPYFVLEPNKNLYGKLISYQYDYIEESDLQQIKYMQDVFQINNQGNSSSSSYQRKISFNNYNDYITIPYTNINVDSTIISINGQVIPNNYFNFVQFNGVTKVYLNNFFLNTPILAKYTYILADKQSGDFTVSQQNESYIVNLGDYNVLSNMLRVYNKLTYNKQFLLQKDIDYTITSNEISLISQEFFDKEINANYNRNYVQAESFKIVFDDIYVKLNRSTDYIKVFYYNQGQKVYLGDDIIQLSYNGILNANKYNKINIKENDQSKIQSVLSKDLYIQYNNSYSESSNSNFSTSSIANSYVTQSVQFVVKGVDINQLIRNNCQDNSSILNIRNYSNIMLQKQISQQYDNSASSNSNSSLTASLVNYASIPTGDWIFRDGVVGLNQQSGLSYISDYLFKELTFSFNVNITDNVTTLNIFDQQLDFEIEDFTDTNTLKLYYLDDKQIINDNNYTFENNKIIFNDNVKVSGQSESSYSQSSNIVYINNDMYIEYLTEDSSASSYSNSSVISFISIYGKKSIQIQSSDNQVPVITTITYHELPSSTSSNSTSSIAQPIENVFEIDDYNVVSIGSKLLNTNLDIIVNYKTTNTNIITAPHDHYVVLYGQTYEIKDNTYQLPQYSSIHNGNIITNSIKIYYNGEQLDSDNYNIYMFDDCVVVFVNYIQNNNGQEDVSIEYDYYKQHQNTLDNTLMPILLNTSNQIVIKQSNIIKDSIKIYALKQNDGQIDYIQQDVSKFNLNVMQDETIIKLGYNNYANDNYPLKIQYKYNNIKHSDLYYYNNTANLTLLDIRNYIVLSHRYIIPQTFKMYFVNSQNKQIQIFDKSNSNAVYTYILGTGDENCFANVRLDKDNNNNKDVIGKKLYIYYKYLENPNIIYGAKNEQFVNIDHIHQFYMHEELQTYNSNYPYSQAVGFHLRDDATWQGDRGLCITTKIKQQSLYKQLSFIYLQRFWDAYNTIHWQGTLGANEYIHLQYAEVKDGKIQNDTWKDFVTQDSIYSKEINGYLTKPLVYSAYVDTFDESIFKQKTDYVLRMRVYNFVTNDISQYKYSRTFMIDHESVNPANIIDIKYDPWKQQISIQFRVDDTQGDKYNVIAMYYTSDGRNWKTIHFIDIQGQLKNLKSNELGFKQLITHKLIWKTNNYNLQDSSTYRIRIVVQCTKNMVTIPYFTWVCTKNPQIDYYERQILYLQGGKQYYYYDDGMRQMTQNANGTTEYNIENATPSWKRVQPHEYTYTTSTYDSSTSSMVQTTVTQIRDYIWVTGSIQDKRNKIKDIQGRPTKQSIKNGKIVTEPWGIKQYMNQQGTVIVDVTGYKKWLEGHDNIYNGKRVDLIDNFNKQIDEQMKKLSNYKNRLLQCQIENRRSMIKQGFYTNGWQIDDNGNPTRFDFGVIDSPQSGTVNNTDIATVDNYGNIIVDKYAVYYNFQLDYKQTYDSQNHQPLRDEYYDYTQNTSNQIDQYGQINNSQGVLIKAGKNVTNAVHYKSGQNNYAIQDPTSNENTIQDNRYYGSFTLSKQKYPGELSEDQLIEQQGGTWYGSYYWRLRPYNIFKHIKRQIPRPLITKCQIQGDQCKITAKNFGQQALETSQIYNVFTAIGDNQNIVLINPIYSYSKWRYEVMDEYGMIDEYETIINLDYYQYGAADDVEQYYQQVEGDVEYVCLSFLTDRTRDKQGYLLQVDEQQEYGQGTIKIGGKSFKNWVSSNVNKIRPMCCIYDNNYYIYYYKPGINGNNLIHCAYTKDVYHCGEYSQCYPYNPIDVPPYNSKFNSFSNPFVLRTENGFSMWSNTQTTNSGNKICYQESDYTGDIWGEPIVCQFNLNANITQHHDFPSIINGWGQNNLNVMCLLNGTLPNTWLQFFKQSQIEKNTKWQLLHKVQRFQHIDQPFLYKTEQNGTECVYLFYSVKQSEKWNIYMSKSFDLQNWTQPKFLIEGNNPTAVQDHWCGNKVIRLFFNKTKKNVMVNGVKKDVQRICSSIIMYEDGYMWCSPERVQVKRNISSAETQTTVITNEIQPNEQFCVYLPKKVLIPKEYEDYQEMWGQLYQSSSSDESYSSYDSDNSVSSYSSVSSESSYDNTIPVDISKLKVQLCLKPKNNIKLFRRYGNWFDYQHSETYQYSESSSSSYSSSTNGVESFGYYVNPQGKYYYYRQE